MVRRDLYVYRKISRSEGADMLPKVARGVIDLNAKQRIAGDGPLRNLIVELSKKHSFVRWFG